MREPTEMELRVAKALWLETSEDDLTRAARAAFTHERMADILETEIDLARVAIRAMRDFPTIQMADAGLNAGGLSRRSHAVTVWHAMIDAASPPG